VSSAASYPRTGTNGPGAAGVVGRESELAVLRVLLDRLHDGEGAVVLIAGASGIGKTTLVELLRSEAADRGARILIGGCYDLMDTPPYGPWLEMAESAALSESGFGALPLLISRQDRPRTAENQAAFVRDCLASVAQKRPLLVILEDLHWADPASVDLFRSLSRHAVAVPMLLVATYRTEDVGEHDSLYSIVPLIVREAHAVRLDLEALDDGSVSLLVQSRYSLATSDRGRLVEYLQARAQGNPFFLHELLRELEVEHVLRRAGSLDDAWQLGPLAGTPLPKLVQQVLDQRLDRLGAEDRQLLAAAAVIGEEVPLELWSEVSRIDEQNILNVVERAVATHVMRVPAHGTSMRFAHALIREVLYEGLLPARRRVWHRSVAEALISRGVHDPDAIAFHLRQAGDHRASMWLIRSAERAQGAYAWLTAAERYEAALAELEDNDATAATRARLLVVLACLRRYSDPQWGIAQLYDAERLARIAGNPALTAAAQFDRGHLRCMARDFEGGLADMQRGLAGLEVLSPAERADIPAFDVLGVSAGERELYHRGVLILFFAVLGHLAEAGASTSRPYSSLAGITAREWLGRGWRHAALGEPDRARQAFAQAREAYGDQYWEVGTTYFFELDLVVLPFQTDRLGERRRLADEAETTWKRASGALSDLNPRLAHVPLLYLEGKWTEARDLAQTILSALRSNDAWRRYPGRFLGAIAREQNDPELAWRIVREEFPAGPATLPGGTWFLPGLDLQRLAASLAIDVGDLPLARRWLEAHDRWLAWSGATRGRAEGYLSWALWASASRDTGLAQRYVELALSNATEMPQPLALLAAHRMLGELATSSARYDDATGHLRTALDLAVACGAVHERALTLLALATLCRANGQMVEMDSLLAEVFAMCEVLGARHTIARANSLVRTVQKTLSDRQRDPLTSRELEVVALIATGISNQEIAERLILSVRTVERHINSLYRKIDARGRADAVAYAARRGLLPGQTV
jgi:DNA-binding CsgD family transcriptional regulator